jgi:hypothetical protein
MIEMMRKLDEARFFFPLKEAAVFANIGRLVEVHEVSLSERNRNQDNETIRIQAGEQAAFAWNSLKEMRVSLPQLLQNELGFSQVRGISPD